MIWRFTLMMPSCLNLFPLNGYMTSEFHHNETLVFIWIPVWIPTINQLLQSSQGRLHHELPLGTLVFTTLKEDSHCWSGGCTRSTSSGWLKLWRRWALWRPRHSLIHHYWILDFGPWAAVLTYLPSPIEVWIVLRIFSCIANDAFGNSVISATCCFGGMVETPRTFCVGYQLIDSRSLVARKCNENDRFLSCQYSRPNKKVLWSWWYSQNQNMVYTIHLSVIDLLIVVVSL